MIRILLLFLGLFLLGCQNDEDIVPVGGSGVYTNQEQEIAGEEPEVIGEESVPAAKPPTSTQSLELPPVKRSFTQQAHDSIREKFPDVPHISEVVNKVRSGELKVPKFGLLNNMQGPAVKVFATISQVNPYNTDLASEPWPMMNLETDLAVLKRNDTEEIIECIFDSPEELMGLKVGQTVIISGHIYPKGPTAGLNLDLIEHFRFDDCTVEHAEDYGLPAVPKFSKKQVEEDFAKDGKLRKKLEEQFEQFSVYFSEHNSFTSINTGCPYFMVNIKGDFLSKSERFPDEFIDALNEVPVLARLWPGFLTSVTEQQAGQLSEVKYVEHLRFDAKTLTASSLDSLLKIPGITRLTISEPRLLKGDDFSALKSVPYLRQLKISAPGNQFLFFKTGNQFMANLVHTPELRDLRLTLMDIDDEGLQVLSNLPHLRKLELLNTRASGAGLKHLANPEALFDLKMGGGGQIDDRFAEGLEHLTGLRELELISVDVTSNIGPALEKLTNLQQLKINHSNVDSGIGSALSSLKKLKYLHVDNSPVDDSLQLNLENHDLLHSIGLEGTSVGGNVCEALGKSRSLKNIILDDTPVDDAAIRRLVDSAKSVETKIDWISLKNTAVTEAGLMSLIEIPSVDSLTVHKGFVISADNKKKVEEANDGVRLSFR